MTAKQPVVPTSPPSPGAQRARPQPAGAGLREYGDCGLCRRAGLRRKELAAPTPGVPVLPGGTGTVRSALRVRVQLQVR